MDQIGSSNLKYIRAKEGDRIEMFIIDIIIISIDIKIGTDQIEEIGEAILVDKI